MIGKLPLLIIATAAAGVGAAAGAIIAGSASSSSADQSSVAAAPSANQGLASSAGAPSTVEATPSFDSSTPTAVPVDRGHPGQISASFVISTIQTQLAAQLPAGTTVGIDCPRTGLFASVAKDTFDCTFSATSAAGKTRTGQVEVDVTDTHNNWTWKVI